MSTTAANIDEQEDQFLGASVAISRLAMQHIFEVPEVIILSHYDYSA